jgi:pyruvate dehydrogenase E2 component (dihydrolipoamide acetyltransferase)
MDVRLPRLGEGADSGTIASIFVKEGDAVKKDQPVLELESEKAVASIPVPVDGVVTKLFVKEGDLIKVGQLILSVNEAAGAASPTRVIDASVGDEEPVPVQTPSPPLLAAQERPAAAAVVHERLDGPLPAASPTIRKIARDLGIDLRRVKGSERGGRVVLEDLRNYLQWLQDKAFAPQASASASPAPAPRVDFAKWGPVESKKMSTLRKTISAKMVESWTHVPHVTQFDDADITHIMHLRKTHAAAFEKQGARLTVMPFALRAVVAALKQHPAFNASINEATGEIVYKQYYHIGIAVDTEHGLMVPVIRDVDKKSMLQLSHEVQQMADKARERKLSIEEMQGGSFSISNQGGLGGGYFTPIVNAPEVAILGMGRSAVRPVVREGKIEQRTMLPLGLSYDHRIIDGANAARFIVDLVRAFEQFPEDDLTI